MAHFYSFTPPYLLVYVPSFVATNARPDWKCLYDPVCRAPWTAGRFAETRTSTIHRPNSTPYHPSYTSVLSTTKSDETAIAVVALSEAVARKWWEKQRVKPLGKNAWHSLLAICQAAEKRGYTAEHIEQALDYIGTVPSMRQMDLVLRGVGVKTKHEQSAKNSRTRS